MELYPRQARFALWWFFTVALIACQQAGAAVDYAKTIKPLLKGRCYACHGALKQEGELRLDTVVAMRKGGESGSAVVAGQPDKSLILERVISKDETEAMPPKHEGERLSSDQVASLTEWIREGANGMKDEKAELNPREHWAFRPRTRPLVPATGVGVDVRNPVDAFIASRLAVEGLRPAAEAPREVLVRRLYFDLLGVPPDREALESTMASNQSDWYERLVERLLEDPRHGERWGRHWMDIWRYSDWWGLGAQLRNSQKNIWHFRDWLVESLNADRPYDEMVRMMLAADEIAPKDPSQLRATGFLARNWFLFNRNTWMEDTVEHVGKGLLGLTMNCTKCHDHKYDPISQADFYRMRAIFEPYHVRMDVVPDQTDPERGGIPRAFDGVTVPPTYRFVRGEESNPDKSREMEPGVPKFFAPQDVAIEPVRLPVEAAEPERQPWVLDAHLKQATDVVAKSREALKKAEEALAKAVEQEKAFSLERKEPVKAGVNDERASGAKATASVGAVTEVSQSLADPASGKVLLEERFEKLDAARWNLTGGEWKHDPGHLKQVRDGMTRSVARLRQPLSARDIEARLRFTTTGGSTYRSVGIAFDVLGETPVDFTQAGSAKPEDTEFAVYVSSTNAGAKVQATYRRGPSWVYPADGMVGLPLPLNVERTLTVRLRGDLLNVSLDGKFLFAWRTPIARRDGGMQIFTFDATCEFHEVHIAALPSSIALEEPSAKAQPAVAAVPAPVGVRPTAETIRAAREAAEVAVEGARVSLRLSEVELESVRSRAAAMRAGWSGDEAAASGARKQAVRSERAVLVARAEQTVSQKKAALLRAATDKRAATEKEVKTAEDALVKARETLDTEPKEGDRFTPLHGAKWTPTRFLSSGKDDPEVKFAQVSTGRRKALAEWITDPANPLAARVAVNHLWGRHFGTHLAGTPFDLGRSGNVPVYPELLDWLASELVEHGWSMKHLHRLICHSAAYRRSSSVRGMEPEVGKDPDVKFLWRRTPVRLEAEALRDAMLSLAGVMDWTRGGPPLMAGEQAASRRRSLYFYHSNNERNLFLTTFDGPMVKECYRREQSVVPQQALAMSNGALSAESSKGIAGLLTEALRGRGEDSDRAFVEAAFLYVTGIKAGVEEVETGLRGLAEWQKVGGKDVDRVAIRSQFIWVLLNHNDFVTLR
jgi:mono/diheme cytochrome c family protein